VVEPATANASAPTSRIILRWSVEDERTPRLGWRHYCIGRLLFCSRTPWHCLGPSVGLLTNQDHGRECLLTAVGSIGRCNTISFGSGFEAQSLGRPFIELLSHSCEYAPPAVPQLLPGHRIETSRSVAQHDQTVRWSFAVTQLTRSPQGTVGTKRSVGLHLSRPSLFPDDRTCSHFAAPQFCAQRMRVLPQHSANP
jgi:hypothetical protein